MEKIKKFLSTWYGIATVASVIIVVLNLQSFFSYITSLFPQGWDGAAHFVASVEYANNIFPSVWGWLPQYSGGMPYPQYYTPVFPMMLALFYKLIFFAPSLYIFHTLIVLLQLGIVYVMAYVLSKIYKSVAAQYFSMGCFTVLLCSYSDAIGIVGITIPSTLNTSMAPQLLSGICFLFFILGLRNLAIPRYQILAVVSFAGIVLSNAHFILPAIIFFILSICIEGLVLQRNSGYIRKGVFVGGLACFLTAFWSFPLLTVYPYLNSYPNFVQPGFGSVMSFLAFPIVMVLALVVGVWRKDIRILYYLGFLWCIIQAIILVPTLNSLGIVAHTQRMLGLFIIFIPILFGAVLQHLYSTSKTIRIIGYIGGFVVIFFIAWSIPVWSWSNANGGIYSSQNDDAIQEIVSYLDTNKRTGFVSVEVDVVQRGPVSIILGSLIGSVTPINVFNLRESSISSQFLTPIRNAFSLAPEGWGFKSYLMFNRRFTQQPVETRIDIASRAGIGSFLIYTPYMQRILTSDSRVYLEKDFGVWKLFSLTKQPLRARVLSHAPIVFYGPVSFKYRSVTDYDWGKIQEVLLSMNSPHTTIYAHDQALDTSVDFEKGGALFISQYVYKSKERAREKILAFAKQGDVLLVESDNALYKTLLQDAARDKIFRIRTVPRLEGTPMQKEDQYANSIPLIDTVTPVLVDAFRELKTKSLDSSIVVTDITFSANKTTIALSDTPKAPLPVLILQSYFPSWRGALLYLASPTYTLAYLSEKETTLVYKTPFVVYVGWGCTIAAIGVLIMVYKNQVLLARRYRK